MQKKFISFIISISLVFGAVAPCFAVDLATLSAISLNSASFLSDTMATSDTTTVEPDDSQATRYYVNSNGTVTSSSTWINTWGNIVTDITYSLAYSADIIENRLLTLINNLSSYLYSSSTTGYYLWDWSSSTGPIQGAPTGTQSVISQLRALGSSLSKLSSYSTEFNYKSYQSLNKIEEVLTTNSGIQVNLKNWQPYLLPVDSVLSGSNWKYDYIPVYNYTGSTVAYFDGNETSLAFKIKRYFVAANRSLTYGFEQLLSDVKSNNNFNPTYTNDDLTTSAFSKNSFWKSFLEFAQNTSGPLHRLAFVLASDEEIAARQAAKNNTDAVVDDFISSSGSGSVSTIDLGEMAAGSSAIKSALSSNASASDAFGVFNNDSSIWDWFTQGTKDSFDNVSRTRNSASYTSYYEDYISKVLQGVNENERR